MSEPDNNPLTKVQRALLVHLLDVGPCLFYSGARGRLTMDTVKHGGREWQTVKAYQSPEYFLLRRGLIQQEMDRALPGHGTNRYGLTDAGIDRAERIKFGGKLPKVKYTIQPVHEGATPWVVLRYGYKVIDTCADEYAARIRVHELLQSERM